MQLGVWSPKVVRLKLTEAAEGLSEKEGTLAADRS